VAFAGYGYLIMEFGVGSKKISEIPKRRVRAENDQKPNANTKE